MAPHLINIINANPINYLKKIGVLTKVALIPQSCLWDNKRKLRRALLVFECVTPSCHTVIMSMYLLIDFSVRYLRKYWRDVIDSLCTQGVNVHNCMQGVICLKMSKVKVKKVIFYISPNSNILKTTRSIGMKLDYNTSGE